MFTNSHSALLKLYAHRGTDGRPELFQQALRRDTNRASQRSSNLTVNTQDPQIQVQDD